MIQYRGVKVAAENGFLLSRFGVGFRPHYLPQVVGIGRHGALHRYLKLGKHLLGSAPAMFSE